MEELDYVEKNTEKLPVGPCCDRQGLLHLDGCDVSANYAEMDNCAQSMEKLPIGPCCDRQGLLHLVMYSRSDDSIKKSIASGTGWYVSVIYAEMVNLATVDASASAGFEHLQSMKELTYVDR